jgi:hypothetical protein
MPTRREPSENCFSDVRCVAPSCVDPNRLQSKKENIMNKTMTKTVRPSRNAFAPSASPIARSAAKFDAARRHRIEAQPKQGGVVVAMKDAAPGLVLIGVALAEAIFVQPIRGLKRKLRRVA